MEYSSVVGNSFDSYIMQPSQFAYCVWHSTPTLWDSVCLRNTHVHVRVSLMSLVATMEANILETMLDTFWKISSVVPEPRCDSRVPSLHYRPFLNTTR
ncbi:hypothetical protein F5X99DRAFT_378175 [Biscogniauxia marginata]|nr:hypothetical protein F5X99DRAFT_378175 [Biscogniauxia marginata]